MDVTKDIDVTDEAQYASMGIAALKDRLQSTRKELSIWKRLFLFLAARVHLER